MKRSELEHRVVDRRTFLRFAMAGSAAAAFLHPALSFAKSAGGGGAKAKACIVLWMSGGPSQLDTFDPKPGESTGGPFKAIETSVKGVRISEHLPRVASQAEHYSILRAVTTKEAAHERATHLMHTGYAPIQGLDFAPLGTVVSREKSQRRFPLPTFVALSPPAIPQSHVFGETHLPFAIENVDNPLPDLRALVERSRDVRRSKLLSEQNAGFAEGREGAAVERALASSEKALDLMNTPLLRAFDLKREPANVRRDYGGPFGQKCLLARRLVEAGVPFVEVGLGGWDNHDNLFDRVKKNSEHLDRGMGTLLEDLAARGLLDETLVIWMGEFGRTPRINGRKGRDHWSRCFSVVMAGGGVEGGRVIGATNREGTDIAKRPVGVPDLFTTVFHLMGIDPDTEYEVETRPVTYGYHGRVIRELV